jgi:hypothetical protein
MTLRELVGDGERMYVEVVSGFEGVESSGGRSRKSALGVG